jgi:hypothetical protein
MRPDAVGGALTDLVTGGAFLGKERGPRVKISDRLSPGSAIVTERIAECKQCHSEEA